MKNIAIFASGTGTNAENITRYFLESLVARVKVVFSNNQNVGVHVRVNQLGVPSLLPKFGGKGMYGRHVHEAVVAAGEEKTGITIHYINGQYDEGAILFQAECPVYPAETPEEVAMKVHTLEYKYYPLIIEKLLTKEL
ncbi:MAG: phosphoribosylglycinamide formyltransferase [Parabacteroides sp.]|nr:phosphoribosylglycinamide formyltransferase [Parabacteroides sp.]